MFKIKRLLGIEDKKNSKIEIQSSTVISADSKIGDYTYVGFNTMISRSIVGRYCSIANNVSIGHGEHIIDEISTSSLFYSDPYGTLTSKPCTIGNDVWVGVDAIIKRGVDIGDGAIVGANSFVNKDVPPFAIVAGSPAKVIKYRFPEDIRNIISDSSWWSLELEQAKEAIAHLKSKIRGQEQ
ncbi:MAG: CatB-related O-acetyltransferase [Reichenbachiella sp.]|uniref:CatB-related O-acetyltransferase n=1 Tax=Reichenbachiella sp. TaxID=2184521 RepID=UPI003264D2F7